MATDDRVTRFCPECGARVKAKPEVFASPRACPNCKKTVAFHDHPKAAPIKSAPPLSEGGADWLAYAPKVAVALVLAIAVALLPAMLFGYSDIALFLAGVCAALALLAVARFSLLSTRVRELEAEVKDLESLVSLRTQELGDAIVKYRGFQRNFDQIVGERLAEIEADRKAAAEMRAIAEERYGAIDRIGRKFLADTVKNISQSLTANNFTVSRERLQKAIEFCRKHDCPISQAEEEQLLNDLRTEFEAAVRKQHAKEEQARIKARIREEQRAELEIEREMQRIQAEKSAIEKALAAALKTAADEHSAEVEALRLRLREAEERSQRALSMAQQTRAGYVYVISNVGSFGDGVFKVGMTRRLEPLDRIKELGDASVPFPFDVHMMISCDDAPSLENALHRELHAHRINRVNLRKEYFRTEIDRIREIVEANHGEVEYVASPEALEYYQSLQMTDEDFALISTQSAVPDEEDNFGED